MQAIERRAEPDSTIGIEGDEIRPFFQSNVGNSAWGLAIHSEARILATSSNSHEVRVFKFGLLQTDDLESSQDEDEDEQVDDAEDLNKSKVDPHRKTDVTHHVLNGQTNIPYISFCNTGDDPEARWLLTTDIGGVCRVMDLHSLEPVQAFRFGPSLATPHAGGLDRHNAGWNILFLDQRSFKPENDAATALGVDVEAKDALPKVHRNGDIWDLSNTVRSFDEYSEPFLPYSSRPGWASTSPPEGTQFMREQENDDSTMDDTASEQLTEEEDSGLLLEIEMQEDAYEDDEQDSGDESQDDDEDGGIEIEFMDTTSHNNDDSEQNEATHNETEYHTASSHPPSPSESNLDEPMQSSTYHASISSDEESLSDALVDDAEDPDDEGTEDTIAFGAFYNGQSVVGNEPRFVNENTPLSEYLPCPVLHASVRNVYLLQPSRRARASQDQNQEGKTTTTTPAFHPPMLGLANPLRQTIHQQYDYLRYFERLNMSASIPSLGLVVLASQKGRALILSLTKLPRSTTSSPPLQSFSTGDRSTYCMRVSAILPFADQEQKGERSRYPLHGIAVAPIQGSDTGRWRLMMMYQDHSILSYELSRKGRQRDSGVDVGSVVV